VSRPRDTSIDERALAATLELLAEDGFEATTMQAVAARADVHSSALYRRWPSRVALIEDAVSPVVAVASFAPTGDLVRDLRRFVRAHAATWSTPAARAAMPGLLAHYQATGTTRSEEEWLPISARPQFLDILRAAPDGDVDPFVDPDDVFDVLLGAVMARSLVPTVVERDRPLERTLELVLRMLAPRPATAGGHDPRSADAGHA
jgi:AcrR family transcriptional regulator